MANESTDLFRNLMRVMSALRTRGARHYQVHFTSQSRALFAISKHDGLTQGELSEYLDIRPSSTSDLIRKLKQKGLIEVTPDETDKRVSRLSVTDAGKEKLTENPEMNFDDIAANLTSGLSQEELTELNELLTKMLAGMKNTGDDAEDDTDFTSPFGSGHGFGPHHHEPHFPPFNRGFFNHFL